VTRTTKETVTFSKPFLLTGFEDALPAGTYVVETESEPLPDLSFIAYRRTQTLLHLPRRGAVLQTLTIDPEDLAVALAKDQDASGAKTEPSGKGELK
jgi:hypothetical protein